MYVCLQILKFFKTNIALIDDFIDKIEDILKDEYDCNKISEIFGIHTGIFIRRSANRNAQNHLRGLASRTKSNPQSNDNDIAKSSKKVHLFYGNPPIHKEPGKTTYAEATTPPATNDTSKLKELEKKIAKLDKDQKQYEQSIATTVTNNLMVEVDKKIEKLDHKINSRITNVEAKHAKTINKLFETWDERNLETKKLILEMCDGNNTSIQAPSDSSEEESAVPGVTQ